MKSVLWVVLILFLVFIASFLVADIISMKKAAVANEKAATEVIATSQKLMLQFKEEKKIQEQRNLKITNSVPSARVIQSSTKTIDKYEKIIDCLCMIESSKNPRKVGDHGEAIGILQMHPEMVKDANRIVGWKKYKLTDRWCPIKSREIARVYLEHYTNESWNAVHIARCWNGGPDGHKEYATLKYGKKFLSVYR